MRHRPRRTSRLIISTLAFALVVGAAWLARAQPAVDSQHFQPHANGEGWYATQSAATLDLWQPAFGAWWSYARNPITVGGADGRERVVGDLMTLDLQAAIGFGVADLAVDVPVHLLVAGGGVAGYGPAYQATAFGDIRVVPKVRFLDPEKRGFGLGLSAPVSLPTGNEQRLVGHRTAAVTPTLLLTGHLGPVRLGGNVGYRITGAEPVGDLTVGQALVFRAAGGVSPHEALDIGAEIYGNIGGETRNNPVEWLAGVTVHPARGLDLHLAGGTSIGPGIGAPQGRVLFGVGFSPQPARDLDLDGIADKVDACPEVPEDTDGFEDLDGCPESDNDGDGLADAVDACPDRAENPNGWDDEDGCPEEIPDTDGDGLLDNVDICPETAEDLDGHEDADGCPDRDNDGDLISDARDQCPDRAEVYNNINDDDGCPDEGRIVLTKDEIKVVLKVHYFETDSDLVRDESKPVLDDVAGVMQRFENLMLVEVRGFTDARGDEEYNQDLSDRRADAIARYLRSQEIAEERLIPKGYGETWLVYEEANDDFEHGMNRRVQFMILEREPDALVDE
jgi:outer membrane protein OmpA-like peptidoglycan-associated protein